MLLIPLLHGVWAMAMEEGHGMAWHDMAHKQGGSAVIEESTYISFASRRLGFG
jgi:hypothetical protein